MTLRWTEGGEIFLKQAIERNIEPGIQERKFKKFVIQTIFK
jgi:hypothetical protein